MSKALCCYAFECLIDSFDATFSPIPYKLWLSSALDGNVSKMHSPSPLFVTWTRRSQLCGCIGTFSYQPLEEGIRRFAISAATHDSRFTPISLEEICPGIEVTITLLSLFFPINSCLDWTIGEHGLQLEIDDSKGLFLGTFLPSVAVDQEWDKETTLVYLLQKAGYPKISRAEVIDTFHEGIQNGTFHLKRYKGLTANMSFQEYLAARKEL